jgi:uncharacterized cysteine cluster protein YcgN (CxxCxxCC family)
VVHFVNLNTFIYWVTFSFTFLRIIHSEEDSQTKSVNIKHIKSYNLIHENECCKFIEDFVYLVHYITDDCANIKQLHKSETVMHHFVISQFDSIKEKEKIQMSQLILDDAEMKRWQYAESKKYSSWWLTMKGLLKTWDIFLILL